MTTRDKIKVALAELRADYEWRSPKGVAQRHLVIPRELAKVILEAVASDQPLAKDPPDA